MKTVDKEVYIDCWGKWISPVGAQEKPFRLRASPREESLSDPEKGCGSEIMDTQLGNKSFVSPGDQAVGDSQSLLCPRMKTYQDRWYFG